MAYGLGLIDERTRNSLDHLRSKIRNHFAHYAGLTPLPKEDVDKLLDLGEPSIKLGVAAFGNLNDPKFTDTRVKISLSMVSLWAKIKHKSRTINESRDEDRPKQ